MKNKVLWLSTVAVFASFLGGFLLANALNRNELNSLRADNERLKSARTVSVEDDSENNLTDGEIRQKVADADRNPDDFAFQKGLGLALYRYATVKQDTKTLQDVARLLRRANELNPGDYDVTVALGNLHFDFGYAGKDNSEYQMARRYYQTALAQKADDADVRTDLGLTYFLANPPETGRAIVEFQKSLQTDAKHEKTLQVLTQALLSENKTREAEKYLELLKSVNGNNEALPELTARLAQGKNSSEKQ